MADAAQPPPTRVLVTGAAGQIAYSLIFNIARGDMLGPGHRVILHLLDVPGTETRLEGLCMELEDCAFDLCAGVVATSEYATAFKDVDVALLVGARPRGPGMERKDLLAANASIFKGQGEALEAHASRSVRVLVVGNPANTNALIAATHAPSIPRANFSALTRLDHNRARAALAKRVGVLPSSVKNVIIWGNHSSTQFPDARYALARAHARGHDASSIPTLLGPEGRDWLRTEFVTTIQQRGKTVIDKRGASSAASAATAICDAVRDWMCGSDGEIVSMGVYTSPATAPAAVGGGCAYAVAPDLVFSLPVVCEGGGRVRVVNDLALDAFAGEMLKKTETELLEERALALPEHFPAAAGSV